MAADRDACGQQIATDDLTLCGRQRRRAPCCYFFGRRPRRAKARDTLGFEEEDASRSRLSIVPFADGPKRSMGHVLGAEKEFFLIPAVDAGVGQGGHAG